MLSVSQTAYGLILTMLPLDLTVVATNDDSVVTGYAFTLWQWLISRFRSTAHDSVYDLWQEFMALALNEDEREKWSDFKARVDDYKNRIEATGDKVSAGLYNSKLILRLPSLYNPAVHALQQSGKLDKKDQVDWMHIRATMEAQERQAGRDEGGGSHGGSRGEQGIAAALTRRTSSGLRCYACGKDGHRLFDCKDEAAMGRLRAVYRAKFGRSGRDDSNQEGGGEQTNTVLLDDSDEELDDELSSVARGWGGFTF